MSGLGRTENAVPREKGFFALGVQGISKAGNLGNLVRSAHAFGASFVFTVESDLSRRELNRADTSKTFDKLPLYQFASLEAMTLPDKCALVGVELTDDAVALPSFRHPLRAAYILGPEKSSLSPEVLARCDHVVKIPTRFCVNVATAGAILMYDRQISMARFADRPVRAGGPTQDLEGHQHGGIFSRDERIARAEENRRANEERNRAFQRLADSSAANSAEVEQE